MNEVDVSAATELARLRYRLSVADFHRMGEIGVLADEVRVELVDGQIVDMTPIGTAHAWIVDDLTRRFVLAVGERAVVRPQNPVVTDNMTELQPDVALLRPPREVYRLRHPRPSDVLLLVEVADSSLRYDQHVKIPLYARCGIPEVWLIDTAASVLTVHRAPSERGYGEVAAIGTPGVIRPVALQEVAIDLSGLFGA
jgi:Uma2 family endonuclease